MCHPNLIQTTFCQIVCGDEKDIRKCKYYCVHRLARQPCAIHYRLSAKKTMHVQMGKKPLTRNFFFANCFVDFSLFNDKIFALSLPLFIFVVKQIGSREKAFSYCERKIRRNIEPAIRQYRNQSFLSLLHSYFFDSFQYDKNIIEAIHGPSKINTIVYSSQSVVPL